MRPIALALVLLVLGSCGGEGGLTQDAGLVSSDYVVVDLTTGVVEPRRTLDAGDPALRDRLMAFRRIPAGRYTPGVVGADIGENDEKNRDAVSTPETWLAVFELTGSQWLRLGGAGSPSAAPVAVARGELEQKLQLARSRSLRLDLPDGDTWEWAVAAGAGSAFCWGESLLDADSSRYAVVDVSPDNVLLTAPSGPAVVGSKLPNAWGLYDMQGNLWEHVRSDHAGHEIRGGSWAQPAIQARSSNRVVLDYDVAHPLVGVRLTWEE